MEIRESQFKLVKEEVFYCDSSEALAWVSQRGDGCSIPGNVQGQVELDSEQPDGVEDVAGIGLDEL